MPSSDLQVVTEGGVLSHTPAKRGVVLPGEQSDGNPTVALDDVPPHTSSRAETDSEHNPSSQASPIGRDNSRFTQNEDTGYNAKESVEKKNTVEQRPNTTLDERNESRPGDPGHDAYRAQHRQTKPVSSRRDRSPHTAPSPNIVQSRREQPDNPINGIDSGSPYAHDADQGRVTHKFLPGLPLAESPLAGPTASSRHPPAPPPSASLSPPNGDREVFSSSNSAPSAPTTGRRGMHTNSQPDRSGYHPPPHSQSQRNVSTQPSRKPLPDTTTQNKPENEESATTQKRKIWSFIIRCECIHA